MDHRHQVRSLRQHPRQVWWKRKRAKRFTAISGSLVFAVVASYAVWFLGPHSQSPFSRASAHPPRAHLTLIRGLGNAVIPQAISRVPQPPSFPAALFRNHCGTWSSWFVAQHAAQAEDPFLVQVSAPAKADVTVVGAQVTVYR